MNETNELEELASVWRSEKPGVPPDLRRLVRREGLRMRLRAAAEVLITITFLGGSLWLAIAQPTLEFVVLAGGIWIITLTTLTFSLANRAGTWKPAAQDTREFLALSLRRCRAALAAIRFGFWLLAVELVLLSAWQAWYWSSRRPAPSLESWLLSACLPAAFLVVLLVLRSRKQRELARLAALERDLIG